MRAIKINTRAWVSFQFIDRVIHHRKAIGSDSRRIGIGRLAPLVVRIGYPCVAISKGVVPWDDTKTIRLKQDNSLIVTNARCKTVDPSLIFGDRCCSTRAVLRTVAERDVVRNQNRNLPLVSGALNRVSNILHHSFRSALCEPNSLWRSNHLFDEIGIRLLATGCEISNLIERTMIRLRNIELRVGIETCLWQCRSGHRRRYNDHC